MSDRDKIFISKFWKDLIQRSRTTLSLSSAYHLVTDGQTEATNKMIEQYLMATVHQHPRTWADVLPWAEFWYNSSYHHSIKTTPFHVVYWRAAPEIINYKPGDSMVEVVDELLTQHNKMLAELWGNL